MERGGRDHGGFGLGVRGCEEGNRVAAHRPVRLRAAQPARSDAGAARKAHDLCWHVMPFDPDLGGQDWEDFKEEFSERLSKHSARYCPNMTSDNILGKYAYTAKEYIQELPNMRGGDIFMGAFNAEQVMYNHVGYRTPLLENLVHGGIARASRRSDFRRRRLHRRRSDRSRSRRKIVVAAGRRGCGTRRA